MFVCLTCVRALCLFPFFVVVVFFFLWWWWWFDDAFRWQFFDIFTVRVKCTRCMRETEKKCTVWIGGERECESESSWRQNWFDKRKYPVKVNWKKMMCVCAPVLCADRKLFWMRFRLNYVILSCRMNKWIFDGFSTLRRRACTTHMRWDNEGVWNSDAVLPIYRHRQRKHTVFASWLVRTRSGGDERVKWLACVCMWLIRLLCEVWA